MQFLAFGISISSMIGTKHLEATRGRSVTDKLQPHGMALVSTVGISHPLSDMCSKGVWLILTLSDNDIPPENYVPMQKVIGHFPRGRNAPCILTTCSGSMGHTYLIRYIYDVC